VLVVARDPRILALDYLHDHQVMTVATVGEEGPWAAAVFYVNNRFNLFFLSAGHTRHVQNVVEQPWAAATIQEDYKDWPAIKGIQLEGLVTQLQGVDRKEAISLYEKKYLFIRSAPSQIRLGLARVNWYCLSPRRLYFIDNSQGLGHRDEVVLG
jgi:uncharacterized protein YhbP (UPF0306 family)